MRPTTRSFHTLLSCLLLLFLTAGCGLPSFSGMIDGLNRQNDLQLVCDGAPSYLLILDSMVASSPDDTRMLLNTTKAYNAYTMAMVECGDPERAAVLSEKARTHGLALLRKSCDIDRSLSLEQLAATLKLKDRDDVPALFWGAYGWATWISYQHGAPAAVIDLPKLELIMQRVLELDETYYNGGAHLFLGVYYSLKPEIYGGKPTESRQHFERALAISDRRFLPVQVAFASTYAKMAFDRELYENLLKEVMAFDISTAPELTLSNVAAQKQAARLLEETDEYF
jgi:hypothetical protein